MNWIDALGTGGALMFAASCIPLAWKTWRQGNGLGTPLGTVWMFTGATVLFTTYLALKVGAIQGPTLISGSEAVAWLVVLWFEYFPRDALSFMGESDYGAFYCGPDNDRHVDYCVRPHHDDGPCNGYPRRDCPMTDEARKQFYPGELSTSMKCLHGFDPLFCDSCSRGREK